MPDRYLQAYRKMRRAGAKPRRADPRYNKPIVLTVPQATTMAAVLLVTGFFVRTAGYAALGLHPATSADIRLAALVRSAVPDVDTLAQDDIVARLSVPPQLGLLLAPLAATDPARASVRSSEWLDAIRSDPAPVTSPDRMRALGEVASGLAPLPADQRADQIDTIIALYRATHDPSSRAIITAVGALPSPQRNRLADTKILQPILAAFATLPDNVLRNLQSDPDRLRLAVSIAGIAELSDAQLTDLSLGLSDKGLRAILIYVVGQVRSGNQEIMTLLNLYWTQTQLQPAPPMPVPAKRLHHAR